MAEHLDRLIEWVVGLLGEAGTEGLSVSVLFQQLGSEFAADDVTKNGVWEGIVTREDVILSDDKKELPLSKSPLKKLSLEDLVALGLIERKIRVKSQEKAAPCEEDGRNIAVGKRKAAEELLPTPPKKRRGRPPKKRDDASKLPSAAGPFTPASSPAAPVGTLKTSTSPVAPVSSTRAPSARKRTKTIKAVEELPPKKPRKRSSRVESAATPTSETKATTEPLDYNATPAPQTPLYVLDSTQPNTRPRSRSAQEALTPIQPAVANQRPEASGSVVFNTISTPLSENTATKPNKSLQEIVPQSLLNVIAAVEKKGPPSIPPTIEQSAQPPQEEFLQDGRETTRLGRQYSILPQTSLSAAAPVQPAPISENIRTDVNKPTASTTSESQLTNANLAQPSVSTPKKTSDKTPNITKRTPKKAFHISALTEASPKFPGERRIRHAVFTSQDDMDRQAGVSRVYIDPAGSERPGVPLQRYGRTNSSIVVFKSAKLRDVERLEKNRGSWINAFAEIIAQGVDEAKKNTTPKRPRNNKRRTSAIEASEGTPSKRKKTSKTAETLIGSELAHNVETVGNGSGILQHAPPSIIVNQLPIQTTSTNVAALSKTEAIPATQSSERVTVATSTSALSPQQSATPVTTIPKPTDAWQQESPAMSSQRRETRIISTQKTDSKSATPPIAPTTSTSSKTTAGALSQSATRIPPQETATKLAAALPRTASSPIQDQNGEPIPFMLTPSVPNTAIQQTASDLTLEFPQNKKIQRIPDSNIVTLGSQPAASLYLQGNATVGAPARAYTSPYPPTLNTSASSSTTPQPVVLNLEQPQWTAARSFGDGSQKPNTSSAAHVFSAPSVSACPLGPTSPGRASERPTESLHSAQPSTLPSQSVLTEFFGHPAHSYKSPYAPAYSSPYASGPAPPVYQEHPPVPQSVFSLPSPIPPAQVFVPGPPKGFFSEQPAYLDTQLSKEIFTPKPRSRHRTSVTPALRQATETAQKRRLSEGNAQANEDQAQPPTRKHRSQPRQEEPTVSESPSNAEAVTVPEGVTRLACAFNTVSGNLLLSKDLSALEFISDGQLPPESPILVLPISQISQNPIVSMPGSNPMELRIKAKDKKEDDVTHCFSFADTDKGSEAANIMRAKIVTALIAYQFRTDGNYERPDDVQQEILKPYKCDKCEARFKNKGGLEYHLTKSATTCNPNCDLTLLAERKERAEKRKRQAMASKEPKPPRALKNKKTKVDQALPEPKEMALAEIEDAEQSDSSTSSDDSIIEFWKNNSTTGVERPRKFGFSELPQKINSRRSKIYKALPFEFSVLREVAGDIINIKKATDVDRALAEGTSGLAESSSVSERLDGQRCGEILLSLVHDNRDIFPGDRSIWIAFVSVWLKKHTNFEALPESKLCSKTVDNLVEKKKLKATEFTFIDTKKRAITRTILTVPGRKVNPSAISLVKESIQASYPAFYVPPQFAPPEPVFSKLNALATRTLPDRYRVRESADVQSEAADSTLQTPLEVDDESSDEFIGDDVEEEEPLADLGTDEEDPESENEDADEVDEDKINWKRNARKRRASHNKAISEGVRRSWERIKASKSGGYFPNRKSRKNRVPLSQEEKDKRAKNTALRLRSWEFAPAFMPNPETGAWDQVPPKPSRRGRRHKQRPRLPEPITYMQALNGAWSVRPFGHGVNPIYSRPSKRAHGNPGFENYRRRIENGFRPILYPTKNRVFLPERPSKALLREMSESNHRPKRPRRSKTGRRISKVTGKPVRPYRKRAGSSQSLDSEATEEQVRSLGFPRWVPNDANDLLPTTSAGQGSRNKDILDEVHLLNFFESKKLELGASRNIGLETIPTSFGLDAARIQGPDIEIRDYQPDYSCVQFIEPEIVEEDLNPGEGSWILRAWEPCRSEDFYLRWDDATAFDLETIPYQDLNSGSDDSETERPSRPPRRQIVLRGQKIKKLTAEQKYSFTRVLTSLPHDFEGVLENPQDAGEEFGVELAQPNEATMDSRRIKGPHAFMVPEVERRFIITVVVIRTLTGGLDFRVDWVLVSQFFQEYSCNFLTKYWVSLQPARKKIIDRLVTDFQEAFLPAYESGEIPRLDYDHLVDYDWGALVDWVMKNVDTTLGNKPFNLPGSKHEVKQSYDLVELERDPKNWRETYFALSKPVYKRTEAAATEPYTVRTQQAPTGEDLDELTLARSWVRATVLTPQQDMDSNPGLAQEKLGQLGVPVVDEVLKALLSEKVILKRSRKRSALGRKYGATEKFFAPLRKHIRQEVFVEAVKFKRFLDEQFLDGADCVRSDYAANEGSIMVTTTLHAQGRIKLVPIGVPMDKFGLTGGGYETKKIPKEKLTFEMDIYPTESYVFDSDNEVLRVFFKREPPHGPETGEIPLWYGISDRIIPDIWKRVLVAVGQIVSLRTGINIAGLKKIFKPTLDEWEIRILIEWGTEFGLFKRLHEGIEGWTVGAEWWLLVGRTCIDGE